MLVPFMARQRRGFPVRFLRGRLLCYRFYRRFYGGAFKIDHARAYIRSLHRG